MFRITRLAVLLLLVIGCTATSWAQSDEQKDFNLARTAQDTTRQAEEALEVPVYEPALEVGKWEFTFTIGFLNLDQTLLAHDQIIYKYTEEATYWGDVKLVGETAFNPSLRVNYNLQTWFALEGLFGISTSQYASDITNRSRQLNEEGAVPDPEEPALTDFDGERRSCITLNLGANALLYPLDFGEGKGRWHPYFIGGINRFWMNLNSNYTDDPSKSWMLSAGLGLRFISDDLISVRLEFLYNLTTLQFTPAEYFDSRDDGTVQIPVYEYIPNPDGTTVTERRVTEYQSQDLNTYSWAIGFVASF
jgi:hypothetical protein